MGNKNKAIVWEELKWKDIEKLTTRIKMVIIPIGSCEQHGPHLPLATDTIDCYEVAKRVSAKTGVPVIPPLTYGCSQSHGDFPGTLAIRPETMIRMICDIVEWLYRSGIRKVLLLNGHNWNSGPIYSARENIRYDFPALQVTVLDWFASTPQIAAQIGNADADHANMGETSCMLAARPDLVNMANAVDEEDYKKFFEYRTDELSKSGIVGREATKATSEIGDNIFGIVVDNLASMVEGALREEIPRSRSNAK
jgi:creatinine amidohydrolase